jgi:hypothetical protein
MDLNYRYYLLSISLSDYKGIEVGTVIIRSSIYHIGIWYLVPVCRIFNRKVRTLGN